VQDIKGREDAIEYAKKFNIPVPVTKKSIYSRDRNLWHISHEVGRTEDPQKQGLLEDAQRGPPNLMLRQQSFCLGAPRFNVLTQGNRWLFESQLTLVNFVARASELLCNVSMHSRFHSPSAKRSSRSVFRNLHPRREETGHWLTSLVVDLVL
jgi:hypothetical protein